MEAAPAEQPKSLALLPTHPLTSEGKPEDTTWHGCNLILFTVSPHNSVVPVTPLQLGCFCLFPM